jgi:ATP-binding cassette subfamily B protein
MNAPQFLSEDTVKTSTTILEMARRLWPYGKKHLGLLAAAMASVLGLALVSRMIPQVIGYAIDHGFREKKEDVLLWVGLAYLGLEVFKLAFSFLNHFLFRKFGNRVLYYLREDIFQHVQRLPLNYFNKTPTGRIVTRMTNDVMNMVDLFSDTVISVFTQSIMIISILIAMVSISFQLTLLSLIAAPLFIYLSHRMTKLVQFHLREQKKKLSSMNSYAAENFNGIKIVQLYNRIHRNIHRFNQYSKEYGHITMASVRSYAWLQPIFNLLTASLLGSALLFGGWMSLNQVLAIGSMVAFIMHVQDFIPPLREILEKYQQFQSSLTSAERIFALLDEIPEQLDSENRKISEDFNGEININNLNFTYDKDLPLVLRNINLQIKAGESIALIGRTGSGKTTLVSLLQKLYEINDDSIQIDGIPIARLDKQNLRENIGIIHQDCFIFRGTIFENINLADARISVEQVYYAAKVTGLADLLQKSNRTLETQVDERGNNLSVGEKQLIAFARIIAFDPKVLILDEATANIDSVAEQIIQRAVCEITKNRTSIIIAHRLSTIQHCDRVFEMKNGTMNEAVL